jgi:hypothetical protein
MSTPRNTDAAAFVRAKEQIAKRRKEVEANHTVVQGGVVHANGRTTR